MLDDSVGALRAIERYSEIDPIFSASKEREFLKKLIDSYEKGDKKGFGSVVVAMQNRRDLEKVTIQMLGFINRSLGRANEAGVDDCPL